MEPPLRVYTGSVSESAKSSSGGHTEGKAGRRSEGGTRASRLASSVGGFPVCDAESARWQSLGHRGLRWGCGPSEGHRDVWFVPRSSRQRQVTSSVTPGRRSAVVGRVQVWRAVGRHGVRGGPGRLPGEGAPRCPGWLGR